MPDRTLAILIVALPLGLALASCSDSAFVGSGRVAERRGQDATQGPGRGDTLNGSDDATPPEGDGDDDSSDDGDDDSSDDSGSTDGVDGNADSGADGDGDIDGGDSQGDGATDVETDDDDTSLKRCQQTDKIKKKSFVVSFGPLSPGCPFGSGGNLAGIGGAVSARVDITKRLSQIPADAALCKLSLSSATSKLSYDDGLVLSLSGIALMTSHQNFPTYFRTVASGLKAYDWLLLRGKPYLTQNSVAWCQDQFAPGSACVVPRTEQNGAFQLKFLDKTVQSIADWAKDEGQPLELKLTVTGDDNPDKDCRVSPINLMVEASYVP